MEKSVIGTVIEKIHHDKSQATSRHRSLRRPACRMFVWGVRRVETQAQGGRHRTSGPVRHPETAIWQSRADWREDLGLGTSLNVEPLHFIAAVKSHATSWQWHATRLACRTLRKGGFRLPRRTLSGMYSAPVPKYCGTEAVCYLFFSTHDDGSYKKLPLLRSKNLRQRPFRGCPSIPTICRASIHQNRSRRRRTE